MSQAVDAFRAGLEDVWSEPYGENAELLVTPWDLPDGETLTLLIRSLGDDQFTVSDRGQIAHRLGLSNVDLSRPTVQRSWKRILDGLMPSALTGIGSYEIGEGTTGSGLGESIHRVAATALQAEGLSALAVTRTKVRFSDRVMQQADQHRLAVIPNAKLLNRFGGHRRVAFKAEGARTERYVMALDQAPGETSFTEMHDRAKTAFADATGPLEQHVTVIADMAKPKSWHLQSLQEVSVVIRESEAPSYWDSFAA